MNTSKWFSGVPRVYRASLRGDRIVAGILYVIPLCFYPLFMINSLSCFKNPVEAAMQMQKRDVLKGRWSFAQAQLCQQRLGCCFWPRR